MKDLTINFKRINNDVNGNPRYVCHFFNLLKEGEGDNIDTRYDVAVKRANKIGGRKYHTKSYGGGIVFQSYNLYDLEKAIREILI